jgi:hypothetical protein
MSTRILHPPLSADVVFLDETDVATDPLRVHDSGVKVKCLAAHASQPWFVVATQAALGAVSVVD